MNANMGITESYWLFSKRQGQEIGCDLTCFFLSVPYSGVG
jgi:hypothetical protein